jgi:hypothetical protein
MADAVRSRKRLRRSRGPYSVSNLRESSRSDDPFVWLAVLAAAEFFRVLRRFDGSEV